jgi:CRP-like cAMP-binding protein
MTIPQQNQLKTGKRPIQQQIRSYKAGEILFEEGSLGNELFIIQEGKLGIYKNTPDGQIELALVDKGGIIGEMSLLDNLPRSATVKAADNAKVLIVNQMAFQGIIDAIPVWLQSIIKIVVSRLRDTNKRVDQSILRDKKRGLVSLLLLLFPVHKRSIDGFNGLDYELILIEGFFISRLRKKEIQNILEQIERTRIIEIQEIKENNTRIVVIKEFEVLRLYE